LSKGANDVYFPVLRSGAAAQYPVARMIRHGLIRAEAPGGAVWLSPSGAQPVRRWQIRFHDLTDAEIEALLQFHEACGGWKTFRFADPMANLLRWSEDLTMPVWGRSAGITVTRTGQDADGASEFLIVNTSAGVGYIWQDLDLAPGAICCFSCELWSAGIDQAVLHAAGERKVVAGAGAWKLEHVTGVSPGGPQPVQIEIGAGGSLFVRRLMAELQLAPSSYKPSFEDGGVYASTRFALDGIRVVTTGPDRHSAEILLETVAEN